MPELDKIVEQINLSLKEVFHVKDKPCQFLGVADVVPFSSIENSVPAVISRGQDGEISVYDDRYVMTVYHRVAGISYGEDQGYGDEVEKEETANMVLVCWCDPVRLKQDRHRIFTLLGAKLSQQVELSTEGSPQSTVEINNINTNSRQVFEQEYRGFQFNVSSEHLLFSLTYSISSILDTNCFGVCPEC